MMEGIEEAMENLEYADAMREGAISRPTKDWDWLDSEDLVSQIQNLDPSELDLETFCTRNLGLYLVRHRRHRHKTQDIRHKPEDRGDERI
jgi:hypothetical protein